MRSWIDSVTSDHPVWINRLDGHMALANSAALRLAGVDARTPDVEGGTIVRDATGAPTGVLKDNAMGLVDAVVPPPDDSLEEDILALMPAFVESRRELLTGLQQGAGQGRVECVELQEHVPQMIN